MLHKTENAAVEVRRAYLKKWRAEHPEKVKEYNISYWRRKAERAQEMEAEHAKNR